MSSSAAVTYCDKLHLCFSRAKVVDKVKMVGGKSLVFYTESFAANVTASVVLHAGLLAEILALGRKDPPRKEISKALRQQTWHAGEKPDWELETFALRCMFSDVGRHSRNVKDGTRTPKELLRCIELYKQCIPDRSPSPRDPLKQTSFSQPRVAKEEVGKKMSVRDKIFAKYNLKAGGPPVAFKDEILVAHASDTDSEDAGFAASPPLPDVVAPQTFGFKTYTDYACQRLMRLHSNGNLEPGEMFVSSSSAFMQCRFRNGDVLPTEFPALAASKSQGPVRKRPAAFVPSAPVKVVRQKLPEPEDEGEEGEEEEALEDRSEVEEESVEDLQVEVSPAQSWAPGARVVSRTADGKIRVWSFSNAAMQGTLVMCYAERQTYLHCDPKGGSKLFFGSLSSAWKDHPKIMQSVVSELLALGEEHYGSTVELKAAFLNIRDRLKAGNWIE